MAGPGARDPADAARSDRAAIDIPFVSYTPPDLDDTPNSGWWESVLVEVPKQSVQPVEDVDLFAEGALVFDSTFHIAQPTSFTFGGPGEDFVFRVDWSDGWKIEVNSNLDWNGNAKMFWNAIARLVGQKAPFGW